MHDQVDGAAAPAAAIPVHKLQAGDGNRTLHGMPFLNWNRGRGGGGAIDLVMHLEDLDFPAAVAWLRQRFCLPAPAASARPAARRLRLPPSDASPLSVVRRNVVLHPARPVHLLAALRHSLDR